MLNPDQARETAEILSNLSKLIASLNQLLGSNRLKGAAMLLEVEAIRLALPRNGHIETLSKDVKKGDMV